MFTLTFFLCTEHASQPDEPNAMLKGMKGYQLTPSDLEFIKKMQQEKLLKKLQVIVCFFSLAAADCCVVVR